jgi:hypothetical protein
MRPLMLFTLLCLNAVFALSALEAPAVSYGIEVVAQVSPEHGILEVEAFAFEHGQFSYMATGALDGADIRINDTEVVFFSEGMWFGTRHEIRVQPGDRVELTITHPRVGTIHKALVVPDTIDHIAVTPALPPRGTPIGFSLPYIVSSTGSIRPGQMLSVFVYRSNTEDDTPRVPPAMLHGRGGSDSLIIDLWMTQDSQGNEIPYLSFSPAISVQTEFDELISGSRFLLTGPVNPRARVGNHRSAHRMADTP